MLLFRAPVWGLLFRVIPNLFRDLVLMLSTGDGGPLTVDLRRPPAEGSIANANAFRCTVSNVLFFLASASITSRRSRPHFPGCSSGHHFLGCSSLHHFLKCSCPALRPTKASLSSGLIQGRVCGLGLRTKGGSFFSIKHFTFPAHLFTKY